MARRSAVTLHKHVGRYVQRRWASTVTTCPPQASVATGDGAKVPGFCFSGCGWLLPFHAGVAQRLLDAGVMPPLESDEIQRVRFVGASGGALIAAALACGVSPLRCMSEVVTLAHHCREHGVVWQLKEPLEHAIRQMVPADALRRLDFGGCGMRDGHQVDDGGATATSGARIRSRLGVAVTNVHDWSHARFKVTLQRPLPVPLPTYIDEFGSLDDLVDALVTSSYVPMYLSGAPATRFRDKWHVDGGLAEPVPRIDGFLQVTMLPFMKADITPQLVAPVKEWYGSIPRLLRAAFIPGSDGTLWDLFHFGEACAAAWVEEQASSQRSEGV